MSKIIICGDVVPTKSNHALFAEMNINEIIGDEIFSILNSADYVIMNLEAPICEGCLPISKCGPNLSIPLNNAKGICKINPHLYSLCNNHIMDYGYDGLRSTIDELEKQGVSWTGVGKDLKSASKPFILNLNDLKIAICTFTEHEFCSASESQPGANPYDPVSSLKQIKYIKNKVDYLFVIYHGGKEFYRYPSPEMKKRCHEFIDCGADLVIVQHTHCVGSCEYIDKKAIIYGQGNFIFDGADDEYWNSGLILEINIDKEKFEIDYIPFIKVSGKIKMAYGQEANNIINGFKERSRQIENDKELESKFSYFAEKHLDTYLRISMGKIGTKSFLFRLINRLCMYKFTKNMFTKKNLLSLLNIVECEANREVFIKLLKEEIRNRNTDE